MRQGLKCMILGVDLIMNLKNARQPQEEGEYFEPFTPVDADNRILF